jgi:beta-1,4-mannosyl-glycoprotein beta-1,4-N-acetylglucosaminyltransferase
MENAQRNHIRSALEFFPDDAIVFISDVDEIPHKECPAIAQKFVGGGPDKWEILALQQIYFSYNFNQRLEKIWHGTVVTTNAIAKQRTPQGCRNIKYSIAVIPDAGWHLTYWGTVEQIQSKIQSFAHQELNTERFTNPDYIKGQILAGKDLYSRDHNPFIPADPNSVPADFRQIFENLNQKLVNSVK